MKLYTNRSNEMATIIFEDGDGLILKRGETKQDKRAVVWMDKTIRVSDPKPVRVTKEPSKQAPVVNKDKVEE